MARRINKTGRPINIPLAGNSYNGLMSAADKKALDALSSAPQTPAAIVSNVSLSNSSPETLYIGSPGAVGTSTLAARADHKHLVVHGDLDGGTYHALATTTTAGFMSAVDKDRLDTLWSNPPSGAGSGSPFVWNESPYGVIDGSNDTFILLYSPDPVYSLALFRNGLLLKPGSPYDYVLSGNVVTFNYDSIPISPDILRATYQKDPIGAGSASPSPVISDHGLLGGLADDDHTQYLTSGRADTWLTTKTTSNLTEGSNQYFTNERAQDAVGNILTSSSTVTLTYNDGLNTITAAVIPGGVSHGSLAGLTTGDPHTQYQLRSEKNANSGYAGLTSGGLLSPSRIPAMPLSFLSDVSPGTPLNGYVLTYNASSGQWQSQSPTGGGGGVTDHGALTGLADDDHTQYLTSPRANTWLSTKTTTNLTEGTRLYYTDERAQDAFGAMVSPSSTIRWSYNDAAGKIQAFVSPANISHADLSNLITGNPHTQYQLRSEENTANGYMGLDASGRASPTRLGSGVPTSAVWLRGDGVWATVPFSPADAITVDAVAVKNPNFESTPSTTPLNSILVTWGLDNSTSPVDVYGYVTYSGLNTWLGTKTTSNLTEGSNLYYTDERAQDAFGAMVSPSATIKWSYNDAAGKIQASVSPAGISHSSLASLTSGDPHTQYQLRSEKNAANGYAGLDASGVLSPVRIPPLSLASLSDVSPSAPTNGQTLVYNAASGQWRNESPSAGALTLAGLTDVSPTTPTNNQVLAYHAASGQWRNQSPTTVDDIITCYIDASPDLIAVGKKAYKVIPYNCSVTGWYVVASSSGTIAWDIKKSTFASYPTTATIISGSSPKLTAQSKNSNISITGWSPLSAGDVIDFHISSNTDITNSGLFLKVRRTS